MRASFSIKLNGVSSDVVTSTTSRLSLLLRVWATRTSERTAPPRINTNTLRACDVEYVQHE